METLAQHIVRVITARGWVEDPALAELIPGRHYRVFAHSAHAYNYYMNVKTGALRHGASIDRSIAMFEGDRHKLERWLADVETFCTIGGLNEPKAPTKSRKEIIG